MSKRGRTFCLPTRPNVCFRSGIFGRVLVARLKKQGSGTNEEIQAMYLTVCRWCPMKSADCRRRPPRGLPWPRGLPCTPTVRPSPFQHRERYIDCRNALRRSIGRAVRRLLGSCWVGSVGSVLDRSVGRYVGWLGGRLVGWLVRPSAGRSFGPRLL